MKIKNRLWLTIAFTVVVVQMLYFSTRLAGFVTDFTGLAERIETHGAAGIISSFDFPALQPFTSLFYYLFYYGFALEGWGWHLVFTILHTANAVFLFFLVKRLLGLPATTTPTLIAAAGAALFLFSPYATEVVVWRVGFHYLLVSFLIQATLWRTLQWLATPRAALYWSMLALQLTALLTYELAIITPLLGLVFILAYSPQNRRKQALIQLSLPQFSLVGLYFIANRVFLGNWIGHYGSEVHLNFPLEDMVANVGRYFVKFAAFSRYWPHPWKEGVAIWLRQPLGLLLLVVISAGLLFWMYRTFRRADRPLQLFWTFGLATFLTLVPVLNLYFNYLLHIENDRYGYLAALFFYPAWMALLSRLPRGLFISLAAAYLLVSVVLLHRTNRYWAQSTAVYQALIQDFQPEENTHYYLLNLPDNLQGAPMFRDFSGRDNAFADALQYIGKKTFPGRIEEVVQYNMVLPTDGVQVEPDSTGLKITFKQWGNWWWRRGIGASSYQDSTFIFHNEGHHYRLEWLQKPENARILYQLGAKWENWEGNK